MAFIYHARPHFGREKVQFLQNNGNTASIHSPYLASPSPDLQQKPRCHATKCERGLFFKLLSEYRASRLPWRGVDGRMSNK